jgi:hypothetical protein
MACSVTITATKRVPWKKSVQDKASHQESKLSLMVMIVVVVTNCCGDCRNGNAVR